jgi:hypothetical protein
MAYQDMSNQSVTHTIGRVVDDIRELFREEVALAKAEIRHEASEFGSAIARMSAGAIAGMFGLGFLLLGLAQGFADLVNWPAWGGYLTMAVVLGAVAGIAVMTGRAKVRRIPAMPRTIESVKETKEWMNTRMSSKTR